MSKIPKKKNPETAADAELLPNAQKTDYRWLFLVFCVFMLRAYAWATSELWYDEALNAQRFVITHEDNIWKIFRDYPIANNHILASFINCLWLKLIGNAFDELLWRIPSLLFGFGTIALVMLQWKKYLGEALAGIGGLLLAISPVFAAYAYQFRGYSPTFFFATLAISGVLDVAYYDKTKRGQILLTLSAIALPLLIPTNVLLAPAIAILLLLALREQKKTWSSAILGVIPWCVATLLGIGYYLTIWRMFLGALAEPDGWQSGWAVVGNLLLGLLAHGAILWGVLIGQAFSQEGRNRLKPCMKLPLGTSAVMLACIALACILAQKDHAPFPRVFLVLLPLATFCMLSLCRCLDLNLKNIPKICIAILVSGIVIERFAEGITDYQLKHGYLPDNILQQHYRGETDLREILTNKATDFSQAIVITRAHDYWTAIFYLYLDGAAESDRKFAISTDKLQDPRFRDFLTRTNFERKLAICRTPDEARQTFVDAGILDEKDRSKKIIQVQKASSGILALFELQ